MLCSLNTLLPEFVCANVNDPLSYGAGKAEQGGAQAAGEEFDAPNGPLDQGSLVPHAALK